jgi:iron complex outermembrane recepter protein
MNSKTTSTSHLFPFRLAIGLMTLLALENPEIAASQPPSDQQQSPDTNFTTKKAALPTPPSSSTEAEPDIFQILKEEKESISRGLGQEQPISEAPANVYVITDEDIRHSGATDIPTVLRRIPGMEVMQMTGADFNVSARGNNQTAANHLLVLVDGRPIYEYAFGSVFWSLLPVTLPEIKKIEVMKGPSAAIYGFNAFDGVVNIVTKSPQEMKGNTSGALAQFGGGEFGTIRSTLIHAGTHGSFGYRLSFGHDQNQKWENRDALALRSNKANLQMEYMLRDSSKIVVSGGTVDSNRFDGQAFDLTRESTQVTNSYANAAYERPNFFIRTSWTQWDEERLQLLNPSILNTFAASTDRDGNIKNTARLDVYTVWIQHALDIAPSNKLIYGINAFHNAISHVNVLSNTNSENRLGFYIQDEWKLTKGLTLTAGLRWDLHSEVNPSYSPRISLLYKPHDSHSFRISGSIAYRPPNMVETRTDIRQTVIPLAFTSTFIGSNNLVPEKIVAYEAGYQGWYWNHRVRIRADAFFNHLSNFIGGTTTNNPTTFTFGNLGQADMYGAEVGTEILATSWLTAFANYSTVQIHQTSDLIAQQGILTRGSPSYKVNAGLRGEWGNGITGEAIVHHISSASYPISSGYPFFANTFGGFTPPINAVGSYTLVNLRGAYKIWKEKGTDREAEVAISVFNALNDQHKENPVGDLIGTRAIGWLTIRY